MAKQPRNRVCPYCHKKFASKGLFSHMRACKSNPTVKQARKATVDTPPTNLSAETIRKLSTLVDNLLENDAAVEVVIEKLTLKLY